MEKLIKLLNEYAHTDFVKYDEDYGCFVEKYGGEGIWYSYVEVISKYFGFIKWLVENDKIDFDKVMKLGIPCFVRYDKGEIISVHDVDSYKQLIMILSIQDNPIEFLISILKIS